MKNYINLITAAKNLGACEKLSNEMGADQLADLLFTPQGREFCVKNDFPKSQDLNHIKDNILISHKIFKGKHGLRFNNPLNLCLIDSDAEVKIENPDKLYHIILLENSCIKLFASNYAVISIDVSRTSFVEIFEDKTSMVYINGSGKALRKEI